MSILAIPWLSLLLVGVGGYLLAWTGLVTITDALHGLAGYVRRRIRPRVIRRIVDYQVGLGQEQSAQQDDVLTGRNLLALAIESRPLWIAAGVALALFVSDQILSPLLLILIPLGAELYRTQKYRRRRQRIDEDVSNLIMQVESRYPLSHSLHRTLTESLSTLPDGNVSKALTSCIQKLHMNADIRDALKPLMLLQHPSLNRLVSALAHAQDTRQEVFLDTLRMLREEAESRMDLRRHARRSLTVVFVTTRILQAVLVIAAFIVGLLPAWRTYYTASSKNWTGMMISLLVATIGSLYVEMEMRQLEGTR